MSNKMDFIRFTEDAAQQPALVKEFYTLLGSQGVDAKTLQGFFGNNKYVDVTEGDCETLLYAAKNMIVQGTFTEGTKVELKY